MRKNLLLLSVVSSLIIARQSTANDNIYVDLSVLDTVQQDSIGFVASEPLFPEVKKAPRSVIKKAKKKAPVTAKQPEKKVLPPAVETKTPKPEVKVEVKTPVEIAPQPEIKAEVKDIKTEVTAPQSAPQAINPINDFEKTIENKELNLPVATPNKMESPAPELPAVVFEPETVQPVVSEPENKPELLVQPTNPENNIQNTPEVVPAPVVNAEEAIISAKISSTTTANPDIAMPKEVFVVSFMPDSAEITAENMQNLEEAVKKFDIEHKKKISIKAYNYDNGEDSFRKKRVSLNRATEVRSFFLNKGFKNFSIKVINTNSPNSLQNTVEIEELD